jgi:hypothetical protein
MKKYYVRAADVKTRCDSHALALLECLSIDPLYPKVIRALGRMIGDVSYRDIEDTVIRVRYRSRATPVSGSRGILSWNRSRNRDL